MTGRPRPAARTVPPPSGEPVSATDQTYPLPPNVSTATSRAARVAGADHAALLEDALFQIKRVVVGQDRLVERVLLCLLANGHCLIEGVPGLAKTLTVSTLSQVVGGEFSRVQFTPDLVPADLVGTRIWRPSHRGLRHRVGSGLRQHRARRRDQPGARQAAVRAARGDGRAPGHGRRSHPPAARRRSSCSPRRTPSSPRASTPCPRRSATASSCTSSSRSRRTRRRSRSRCA